MTTDLHFLNFAYGSNMSSGRLRARTPSATALGCARLIGHRLAWHKVGRDGSGKCDIVESADAGDSVWGVVYRIDLAEQPLLDQAEGLGRGYDYKALDLTVGGQILRAGAYVATEVDAALQPFDWYLALVVDGADEHGLPNDYRSNLRRIHARADPDPQRCEINRVHLRREWL